MKITTALLAGVAGLAFGPAAAAEKWDMPLAYPASNFHSENAAQFAACVGERTGGELEIVTHPNGALFKGRETVSGPVVWPSENNLLA